MSIIPNLILFGDQNVKRSRALLETAGLEYVLNGDGVMILECENDPHYELKIIYDKHILCETDSRVLGSRRNCRFSMVSSRGFHSHAILP